MLAISKCWCVVVHSATLAEQPNSSIESNRIEDVSNPQFNPIMWEGMAHAQFELKAGTASEKSCYCFLSKQ